MRRTIFLGLGVLEILSAAVLFAFVWQLPGPGDVHDKVGRIERVSRQTGAQVRNLRDEVHRLRQGQAHATQWANGVQGLLQRLIDNPNAPELEYMTLLAIRDAFGEAARGLDGFADVFSPDGFTQFALAMGFTADMLDTLGIQPVVQVLRSGRRGIDMTLERWPELRRSLRSSADRFREAQQRLKEILNNRSKYEASLKQSLRVVEGLSAAMPMYTDQWGRNLAEQERSLSNLGTSIDEVSVVLPEVKVVGARLMVMTRLLLSLLGAIFLLHGGYLAINYWLRQTAPGV